VTGGGVTGKERALREEGPKRVLELARKSRRGHYGERTDEGQKLEFRIPRRGRQMGLGEKLKLVGQVAGKGPRRRTS